MHCAVRCVSKIYQRAGDRVPAAERANCQLFSSNECLQGEACEDDAEFWKSLEAETASSSMSKDNRSLLVSLLMTCTIVLLHVLCIL